MIVRGLSAEVEARADTVFITRHLAAAGMGLNPLKHIRYCDIISACLEIIPYSSAFSGGIDGVALHIAVADEPIPPRRGGWRDENSVEFSTELLDQVQRLHALIEERVRASGPSSQQS
jgi:hypothetical protein